MGSRIAAHFANAGYPVLLLDVATADGAADRNATAKRGLETARKGSPGAFYTDSAVSLIETGNFEDDLGRLGGCDWILEAVTERLDVKRELWWKVAAVRKAGAHRLHEHQRHPARENLRKDSTVSSAAISWARTSTTLHGFCTSWNSSQAKRQRRSPGLGGGLLRPQTGQRRGSLQGHAELHRQSNRRILRAPPSRRSHARTGTPWKKWMP